MSGFVLWFTGLSGAGKSTLAALVASALRGRGVHVEVLDGDEVRTHLSKGLGFSREDRDTNVRRIGFVAKLVARSGACAITAAISPFRAIRDEQRAQVGRFVEVYCCSSIDALAARDPKGLYRKALAGEIKGFTGIDDPYEEPLAPEVTVYTDRETKEESLAKILSVLERLGYVAPRVTSSTRASSSRLLAPHGGELISRRVLREQESSLLELAQSLASIDLDADAEADVELIATGAYSPLEGFLTSKDWLRVAAEMRLENGLPWPVPVTLSAPSDVTARLSVGQEAALRARDGRIVGIIDISDIFRPHELLRGRTIAGPFGDAEVQALLPRDAECVFLGGKVRLFANTIGLECQTPAETRKKFEDQGCGFVAGFRSASIPKNAEEYAARAALDLTGALLWQVLDSAGAASLALRLSCHEALVQAYFPAKRVTLTPVVSRRVASPRAALLEAIVLQNFGCSHAVLWQQGSFDLRDIFNFFAPGEIAVQPLSFEQPYQSRRIHSMVTTRSALDAESISSLSDSDILDKLSTGESLSEEIIRPEVARVLAGSTS